LKHKSSGKIIAQI